MTTAMNYTVVLKELSTMVEAPFLFTGQADMFFCHLLLIRNRLGLAIDFESAC